MNKIILSTALLGCCLSLTLEASIELTTNLTAAGYSTFAKRTFYKGSFSCYPMGKPGDHTQPLGGKNSISKSGNNTYTGDGTANYAVNSSSPVVSHAHQLSVHYKTKQLANIEAMELSIKSRKGGYQVVPVDTAGCLRTEMHVTHANPRVGGTVAVKYRAPKDTWLIKVTRSDYKGAFTFKGTSSIEGALNPGFDARDAVTYIWVEPGEELIQNIAIDDIVRGGTDWGNFTVSFEAMGIGASLEKVRESYSYLSKLHRVKWSDSATLVKFLQTSAVMLHNNSHFDSTLKSAATRQLSQISNTLFRLANKDLKQDKYEHAVKSMAAVLSYRIATVILTDLQPFCENIEVEFPHLSQSQSILGIRAAFFWLKRSTTKLKRFNYSHYRALLNEINNLAQAGYSYANVMNHELTRKQLEKAYIILEDTMSMEATPFAASLFDLGLVIKHFKSVGSDGETTGSILSQLRLLAKQERPFLDNFLAHIDRYSKPKSETINVTHLLEELDALEFGRDSVIDLLENNTRFLSIGDDNPNTASFMSLITELLAHQINIFSEPVNVPYFDTIRATYKTLNNIDTVTQKMESCIFGGL